jgi:PadR family transcriptional regulator, regulatory protein PadR
MDHRAAAASSATRQSRFGVAPPRGFLLPAVLLLLSEKPGYGYSLVKELQGFRFGRVDGPSVYRALAQLETDGLVESSSEPKAGHERRMYRMTEHGEQILRAWMGVIKEERDHLDSVLCRYRATGSVEAQLAEVEGGWAGIMGSAWSSVSSTSPIQRPRLPSDGARHFAVVSPPEPAPGDHATASDDAAVSASEPDPSPAHFVVVPDRSVILVEARSSVGPITFGAIGVTGSVEASVVNGAVACEMQPAAHLEIAVDGLRSGNKLYDAELLRRINARRFPVVSVDLRKTALVGAESRFQLNGELTLHGVTRSIQGTVAAAIRSDHKLVVTGEHVFDIRDWGITSPTVLMLRIYPDVRVRLHVEAERRPSRPERR